MVRQAGVSFSVTVIKSLRSLKRNECWTQLGFRRLSSVIEQIMMEWHGEEATHLLEARKQKEVGQNSRDKMYPAEPHH